MRFALTGIVFGFFTEWLLGNGKIYSNIIKKSTMRRLSTPLPIQMPRRRKTQNYSKEPGKEESSWSEPVSSSRDIQPKNIQTITIKTNHCSLIAKELASLDSAHEFLIGQFLLLVIYHRKLVCFQLVLLEFDSLTHQVCQLNHIPALRIVFDGFPADPRQLVDSLIVYLGEELFGTQGLIANLFDAFEVLRNLAFQFPQIGLYFLDQLIEKHLHNREIILKFLHNFVPDIIIHKQLVLLLGKSLTINFTLLQPDVALVCDHALPL